MATLLILHDSTDFGGHERMLLSLLPAVMAAPQFSRIVFVLPSGNRRLRAALAPFEPRISVRPWGYSKKRGEPYLRRFRLFYRAALRRLVAAEAPALILLIQGRIENLATALSALPADVPIVSYIPMAHRMVDIGRHPVGDRMRRPLYRRPMRFIVPTVAIGDQLKRAGAHSPVAVAHNVVAPPQRTPQRDARSKLGLPLDNKVALLLGRMENRQKGVDLLLAAIDRAPIGAFDGWQFVFVGNGPARDSIAAKRRDNFRIVSWTDEPHLYLSAANLLLLPSRWEGLPLVLLEAMQMELPVLASQLDVFRHYLPRSNLVDFATVDLPEALQRATRPAAREAIARIARERLAGHSLETSGQAFLEALTGLLP